MHLQFYYHISYDAIIIELESYVCFYFWSLWWSPIWHCKLPCRTPLWKANEIFGSKPEIVCCLGLQVLQNIFTRWTYEKKNYKTLFQIVIKGESTFDLSIKFQKKLTLRPNSSPCFVPVLHCFFVFYCISFNR